MRELHNLDESALMKRLTSSSEPEVRALVAEVQAAAIRSAELLSTVVVDMPLYTLHNERHVLNVIGWMESLLGASRIDDLSVLECAISILAAYVHDLGMTLTAAERDNLESDPDYLSFRDGYVEERHLVDLLRKNGRHYRATLIENHLRTEYIRTTHADRLAKRLIGRLGIIAPRCVYRGFDYRRHLEIVATSHNHPVEWLRLQCEKEQLSWRETVGRNEPVNFACVGILLRLADVMDFDSSRTPTVLFRHLGLDSDLASHFADISSREWKKHLAITGIDWPIGSEFLTYRAANCPHPAVEKSIREFVKAIQMETNQAASELRHLGDEQRFSIRLPNARADVRPARDNGVPRYTFHDWSFRLDQEEIIQLLMGESLYGEPGLCIRELLQNALDAVELRELRLRLRASAGRPAEGVDGEWVGDGQFIHEGIQEDLAVNLSWGEEGGHHFIRVEDNGTGMTEAVIERYFTQIGKSFYRSPAFRGEQAELRSTGLIATPISTFGIGILSCFMLADRVVVRTHPGMLNETRRALDLEISGPGSLFWTRQGTRSRQGTEITLWLRKELGDRPLNLQHNREACVEMIRGSFEYLGRRAQSGLTGLDPALIAARHVLWPRYPIRIIPPIGEAWSINDRFHVDVLAPIDRGQVVQKARNWGYAASSIGEVRWDVRDWVDDAGDEATGSRIRLWLPSNVGASDPVEFWELATLVAPQVEKTVPQLIVQSMGVEDVSKLLFHLSLFPGTGCRVWLDLRGRAAPALTADRRKALIPKGRADWHSTLSGIWSRYTSYLIGMPKNGLPAVLWNVWLDNVAIPLKQSLPDNDKTTRLPGNSSSGPRRELAIASLALEVSAAKDRFNAVYSYSPDNPSDYYSRCSGRARDRSLEQLLDRAPKNARSRTRGRSRALSRLLATDQQFLRNITVDLARSLKLGKGKTMYGELEAARANTTANSELPLSGLQTNWLQEAYFPSLAESWPGTGLNGLEGQVGDALLTAPAIFHFDTQECRVLLSDPGGREPLELAEHGYDICFPMTAIPLGALRRVCAGWRQDRSYRAVGVLPFLVPQSIRILKAFTEQLLQLFLTNRIYAFWPAEELWYKPFSAWTRNDWRNRENYSLLWSVAEGNVWVARGVQPLESMPAAGTLVDIAAAEE
jgi:hypothetical protein